MLNSEWLVHVHLGVDKMLKPNQNQIESSGSAQFYEKIKDFSSSNGESFDSSLVLF